MVQILKKTQKIQTNSILELGHLEKNYQLKVNIDPNNIQASTEYYMIVLYCQSTDKNANFSGNIVFSLLVWFYLKLLEGFNNYNGFNYQSQSKLSSEILRVIFNNYNSPSRTGSVK